MSKNTGKPYEKLTQKIFSQIVNQDSVKNIEVQHDVNLSGKTTLHQIDVYWKFEVGGILYQTVIQAKDWKNKVKKEQMLAFKAVLDDLPSGTKGVFVSKSGFQSGAVEVAKAHGIKIYELREPVDADWDGLITKVHVGMNLQDPFFKNMKLKLDEQWIIDNKIDLKNLPLGTIFHGNHEVVDREKTHVCFLSDIVKEFLPKEPEVETHFEKKFDDAFIVWPGEQLLKIKSISGNVGYHVHKETIYIDIERMVRTILKDILEGSMRSFDKNNHLIGGAPK